TSNYLLLLLASLTVTVGATSGQVRPFLSLDQPILPQTTAPHHRTADFGVDHPAGALPHAVGMLVPQAPAVPLPWLRLPPLAARTLAARFGLINTIVFTHLPSNLLLMLVPAAPSLPWAIGLLLARHALSQMDVPTRQSYTMAVVTPAERTAAAAATNVVRNV